MADVRSKNLYELLGNDPELDPNREPAPPTKVVDRTANRTGKRDGQSGEPRGSNPALARGGPRFSGNEKAFRDRGAGANQNRSKPTDEPQGSRRVPRDDRKSRTGQTVTGKQVDQGWGAPKGEAVLSDEKVGEAIAQDDEKAAAAEGGEEAQAEEVEDKTKSYAEYLAELESSKRGELGVKEARKPSDGQGDKKWASAKELKREEEDAYIKGSTEKARRERQRKEKNVLDVDMRFVEQPRQGGGFRGGRGGRGGDRGGRGGRGEFRGRGSGAPRQQGQGPTVDEKNFPSLGGK